MGAAAPVQLTAIARGVQWETANFRGAGTDGRTTWAITGTRLVTEPLLR